MLGNTAAVRSGRCEQGPRNDLRYRKAGDLSCGVSQRVAVSG